MSDCICPIAAFCQRHNRQMSTLHHRKCQNGASDALAEMFAKSDNLPKDWTGIVVAVDPATAGPQRRSCSTGKRSKSPQEPVGTALKSRIENLMSVKTGKGCGCQNLVVQMDGWGIAGCESRRGEIIAHLVSNREVLTASLSDRSWLAGVAAGLAPDLVLRTGADWLLTQAINDVRAMPKPPPIPRPVRVPGTTRHTGGRPNHNFVNIPLIGQPINRERLQSHIMYHIMPLAGDTEWVWRRHCKWLREVRPQFNGRLIIGIVTPGAGDAWEYCSPEAVKEELQGLGAEFIEAPNDTGNAKNRKRARQGIGEGVLFPKMLGALQTTDPDQVAFYGHCKGVSRPQASPDSASHIWAKAMFETVFRNHDAAVAALDTHGVCGSFRMPGGYRDGGPGIGSNWFYSGTFFGIRLVDAFRRKWSYMPTHYGCVEQWPRLNFDKTTQSACLFFDDVNNLYDDAYWQATITPAFEKWKVDRGTR